jgi:hypothetical protein
MLSRPGILKDIMSEDVSATLFGVYAAASHDVSIIVEDAVLNEDKLVRAEIRRISPGAISQHVRSTTPGRGRNVHRKNIASSSRVPLAMVNHPVKPAGNTNPHLIKTVEMTMIDPQ